MARPKVQYWNGMHVYTRFVSAKDSVLVMTSKNSQRLREFTRKKTEETETPLKNQSHAT